MIISPTIQGSAHPRRGPSIVAAMIDANAVILASEFAVLRCQVRLFGRPDHLASTTAAVIGMAVAVSRSLRSCRSPQPGSRCGNGALRGRTGLRIITQSS
jgi:hypothetical protein